MRKLLILLLSAALFASACSDSQSDVPITGQIGPPEQAPAAEAPEAESGEEREERRGQVEASLPDAVDTDGGCQTTGAGGAEAQTAEITYHKDIEPILQRSCQNCHRVGGAGPMPLATYEQVAPVAGLIEYKTGLRDRAGAMPPWYVEKDIGIQEFKDDPSLSDAEIAAISTWPAAARPRATRPTPPSRWSLTTASNGTPASPT